MSDAIREMDATGQAELVSSGEVSPRELVEIAVNRAKEVNPEVNAIIAPLYDEALTASEGELPDGPFRGVPFIFKDLGAGLQGQPFHMGNRLLKERDFIKASLGDRWWQALGCAAGNWLLDFAALLAALAAVGAEPRPSLVLLGYVVAMILTWIPITPGGLGFVEVGLAATLGLAGVGAAEATTATLAYRLVSFWLPIPAGAVAGALFRSRFASRPSAEAGS